MKTLLTLCARYPRQSASQGQSVESRTHKVYRLNGLLPSRSHDPVSCLESICLDFSVGKVRTESNKVYEMSLTHHNDYVPLYTAETNLPHSTLCSILTFLPPSIFTLCLGVI